MAFSLLILAVSAALAAVTAEQCGKCPFPIQKVTAKDKIVFAVIGGERVQNKPSNLKTQDPPDGPTGCDPI